jgi:hypothetical protein
MGRAPHSDGSLSVRNVLVTTRPHGGHNGNLGARERTEEDLASTGIDGEQMPAEGELVVRAESEATPAPGPSSWELGYVRDTPCYHRAICSMAVSPDSCPTGQPCRSLLELGKQTRGAVITNEAACS